MLARRPLPVCLHRAGTALAAGVLMLATLASGAAQAASAPARAPRSTAAQPCGRVTAGARYRHVIWIVMENYGYAAVTNRASAPYLAQLSRQCGLATNYVAITHPSLPNYIALTAGSPEGIADDGEPVAHPLDVPSIFSQLKGAWRAYEESMPRACDRVTSGSYAARHDPAVYYTNLGTACAHDVLPLTGALDLSAPFTFITPNICNDMHSCPISTGDTWLSHFVPRILDSRAYRSGTAVLFITWDESDTGPRNQVATYVIAPSVRRASRSAVPFTHYSLLRTTEQLLHLPLLGGARTARSMVGAFHL